MSARFGRVRTPQEVEDRPAECCVVVVGTSPEMPDGEEKWGEVQMVPADEHELPTLLRGKKAEWILVGQELDDGDIQRTVQHASSASDAVRLAILGHGRDWRRCDRWIRRGCRVYLENTASLRRISAAIHAAHTLEITVVDRIFFHTRSDRGLGPPPHLTRRERDVLGLISRGLRNREIAHTLHMSENTVEYHVRHLMEKFSARNRLEVYERAASIGLV